MTARSRIGKHYATRTRKGTFKKFVSVGRSLAMDRRKKAKKKVKSGYGHLGDIPRKSLFR
jgi:hypothetical protein